MDELMVLGCVVTKDVVERFKKMLPDGVGTEEAMQWFVWNVATGQMRIGKEE